MKNTIKVFENTKRIIAWTHKSWNAKTGDMAQVTILAASMRPTDAIKSGHDTENCGDCPLKGGKVCYVNPVFTNSTYHAIASEPVKRPLDDAKPVRLGAYGDPAFIPYRLLQRLIKGRKWTGYTHQWHKDKRKPWLKRFLMASVDDWMARREGCTSEQLKAKANRKGYRTFRILKEVSELLPDEILCPAPRVQCKDCLLCAGSSRPAKNIAIVVHGPQNKVKGYSK